MSLADLRAAAKAAGGSVNDAYLAALSGGLGRYHEALGLPVDELPMALPVSLRTADDPAAGNRITGITIAAPVGEPEPGRADTAGPRAGHRRAITRPWTCWTGSHRC